MHKNNVFHDTNKFLCNSKNLLQISCLKTKPLSFPIQMKNTPLKY